MSATLLNPVLGTAGFLIHNPFAILLLSLVVVILSIVWLRLGAFFSLLLGSLLVSFLVWMNFRSGNALYFPYSPLYDFVHSDPKLAMTGPDWCVKAVCTAMGRTVGNIGLLIVLGVVIGKCMTDNGSADRIVQGCRRAFSDKAGGPALALSAFVLSIPVFYDATFYLLLPLAKSFYRNVRKNYVFYLLSVGLAATISHTVIPPTPGPVAVAESLKVPLGSAIAVGLMVGACLCPVALLLAWLLNKLLPNPTLAPEVAEDLALQTAEQKTTDVEPASNANKREMSILVALAPIVVPVVMICASSALKFFLAKDGAIPASGIDVPEAQSFARLTQWIDFLGNANVAMGVAAIIAAITTLCAGERRANRSELEQKISHSLSNAGSIILITAAGGAYGAMLQNTGIGASAQEFFFQQGSSLSGVFALTTAFLLTALLKTAQGSSTTAMITTASIFAAMKLSGADLGCNPAYLVAMIGVGSSVASWMNDSGFCVFSRSSGICETDSLKVWTLGTGLLGCAGFGITLLLSRLVPLL